MLLGMLCAAERTQVRDALRAATIDTAPSACEPDGPSARALLLTTDGGTLVKSCYPFWDPGSAPLVSSGIPALADVLIDLASR